MNRDTQAPVPDRIGYRVGEWCRAIGISRPTFYNLKGDLAPRSKRLKKIPVILEAPGEYAARIAALQASAHAIAA